MQVRLAFLGGLGVVLLLVPINKWLAKRIEAATNAKMAFKDLRVKRMGELLRGIHQIKASAWEPAFIAHVSACSERPACLISTSGMQHSQEGIWTFSVLCLCWQPSARVPPWQ